MIPLPLLNVRLRACSEDWEQMTPTARGRHCAHCNRTVLDFTQATAIDLEAAFRAASDGRVCGRFRPEQLAADQPPPLPARVALRPRLRRFLVALVLVCGLGLGAREAVAQVRQATQSAQKAHKPSQTAPKSEQVSQVTIITSGLVSNEDVEFQTKALTGQEIFTYVEQMPTFRDGGQEGMLRFITSNLRRPQQLLNAGRVFVAFVIDEQGQVNSASVLKGLGVAADTEALRVINLLPPFVPGRQNGRAVKVRYTLPVTFSPGENE